MTSTTVTHLIYLPSQQRFIAVVKHGDGWRFKNGRDAAAWLLEDE